MPTPQPSSYTALLREFAVAIGVPEVEAFVDTEELRIDGLTISFCCEGDDPDGGELLMFHAFAAPAHLTAAELHQILLEANWFWHGTGGSSFGLSPETGEVVFAARVTRTALSGERLATRCAQFIDVLQEWREVLLTPRNTTRATDLTFNAPGSPHA